RRSVLIYLFFPSAFFLSGAYSESVAALLSAAAMLSARRTRWALASGLAGVATLARPLGFVAIGPVIATFLSRHREAPLSTRVGSVVAMIAPAALAAATYIVFSRATFGDPWAFANEQAAMRGPIAPPWVPFVEIVRTGPRLHGYGNSIID